VSVYSGTQSVKQEDFYSVPQLGQSVAGLLPRGARVQSHASQYAICRGYSELGQIFSQCFGFPRHYHSIIMLYTCSFTYSQNYITLATERLVK